jgi:hypothetical protein
LIAALGLAVTVFVLARHAKDAPALKKSAAQDKLLEIPFGNGFLVLDSDDAPNLEVIPGGVLLRVQAGGGTSLVSLLESDRANDSDFGLNWFLRSEDCQRRYPQTAQVLRRKRCLDRAGLIQAQELILSSEKTGKYEHHLLFARVDGCCVQVHFTVPKDAPSELLDRVEGILSRLSYRNASR